jgi:hypothetical protein
MNRRQFIVNSFALLGAGALVNVLGRDIFAALPGSEQATGLPVPTADGCIYLANRTPLQPSALIKLPVGAVKANGWLKHQLDLEIDGICGRYPEVSEFLKYDGNGWVDPSSNSGWEEVTYWLRGLADLGYVTGDAKIIALANKWIKGMIASQQPDGWFGPKGARTSLDGTPDFWPHMPALFAIRSYYEVYKDPAAITFLTKYFAFQNKQPDETFGKSWAGVRWGDNLDSVVWLYNRTGDSFLIDLIRKIHTNSADWTTRIASLHNVNFAQGFREPAQYWLLSGDDKFKQAPYITYKNMMNEFGQMAGGGFAGDENARHGYRDPRQGFETCGIVEYMLSFEILSRITGDSVWLDRCEELAFNMLPASYDPQQKSMHYVTSMNLIQIDNVPKTHGQFQNSFAMQAYMPGVHQYRCCPHNYGMGWPYYLENLWHATCDNGLAATMYAASTVTAKVNGGVSVKIDQETEYPYGDTIRLAVSPARSVEFPLYLRIPKWCSAAKIRVNGASASVKAAPGSFAVVKRQWKAGDVVTLHFPMEVSVREWKLTNNSVSVDRGPLTYSLQIPERWDRYAGTEQWPEYAVYAEGPWNYGLELDKNHTGRSFEVVQKSGSIASNPFTHETNPISLKAKGRKIANWTKDSENVIETLQSGPIKSDEPLETLTLIPMGAARLRITSFPIIGNGTDAKEWVAPVEVIAKASHVSDSLDALSSPSEPNNGSDGLRFTWWDHTGTSEWVQYEFSKPVTVSETDLYWFDDTGKGQCRIPKSWALLYKDGDTWKPVENASEYAVAKDSYNKTTFSKVTASNFRIQVQLQDGFSGGIMRWRLK